MFDQGKKASAGVFGWMSRTQGWVYSEPSLLICPHNRGASRDSCELYWKCQWIDLGVWGGDFCLPTICRMGVQRRGALEVSCLFIERPALSRALMPAAGALGRPPLTQPAGAHVCLASCLSTGSAASVFACLCVCHACLLVCPSFSFCVCLSA